MNIIKDTQMRCVQETYLRLTIDELHFLNYLGYNEPFWSVCDGFITKSRLQSTQDGNLVKLFWWEESKMATSMFEILDGFSLVWVPMYQQSKSAFLQVALNFELGLMDISNRHNQTLLTLFTSLPYKFCERYQFVVQGFSLVCAIT